MPELSVVMPVYNEAESIGAVLGEWTAALSALGIDYELRAYDDGSRDRTGEILRHAAESNPRIVATSHANRGHGPTIMRGYREARGTWVFQTDSDGEMPPDAFASVWALRDNDFIIGIRNGRDSGPGRRFLSAASRAGVRLLFGRGITDVNSPYRLMRREWLERAIARMSDSASVPNVVLSGLAVRTRARIAEVPVQFRKRAGGQSSLTVKKIVKLAARAVVDLFASWRSAR